MFTESLPSTFEKELPRSQSNLGKFLQFNVENGHLIKAVLFQDRAGEFCVIWVLILPAGQYYVTVDMVWLTLAVARTHFVWTLRKRTEPVPDGIRFPSCCHWFRHFLVFVSNWCRTPFLVWHWVEYDNVRLNLSDPLYIIGDYFHSWFLLCKATKSIKYTDKEYAKRENCIISVCFIMESVWGTHRHYKMTISIIAQSRTCTIQKRYRHNPKRYKETLTYL